MLEQRLSYETPKKRSWLRNAVLGLAVGLVGLVGGCGCESVPGKKAADKGQDVYFLDNKLEEISTNVVLPKAVYMIDFDIEVKPKATLEIKPGAELRFGPKVGLACYGVLKAQGTEKDRIIFGGYGQERWSNIMIAGQESNNSLLEYCTIRGGGGRKGTGGGLMILGSNSSINYCTIENNNAGYGGGIYIDGACPAIKNNKICKNTAETFGGGICIIGDLPSPPPMLIVKNIISNNSAARGGGILFGFGSNTDPKTLFERIVMEDNEFINNESRNTGTIAYDTFDHDHANIYVTSRNNKIVDR